MSWERVEPQRGARVAHKIQVTCAWRAPRGGAKAGKLAVTIGSEAVRVLGWAARGHVAMDVDRMAGKIRLQPCGPESGWALAAKKTAGVLELLLRLDWMDGAKRTATPVKHDIEGAALTLTLPSWARDTVRVPAAQMEAPAPAAVPPARRVSIMERVPDPAALLRSAAGRPQ